MVDGSNLATEGRTSPSLKQLDEAVRAYAAEDPDASIIVVVDATFEHRVSDAERDEVRAAMLNGEIISPPAGAIGRGDAFVLRIAERTGAVVLSNDSFQEFHAEHPWLFDEGRLVGGKPVPGVGWIFTPRTPVRGPKSRRATGRLKSGDVRAEPTAPVKAAELAKAVKKAAARRALLPDGSAPKIGDVLPAPDKKGKKSGGDKKEGAPKTPRAAKSTADRKMPAKKAAKAAGTEPAAKKAKAPAKAAALDAPKKARATKAAAQVAKAPAKKAAKAPAKKAAARTTAKAAVKKAAKKPPAAIPANKATATAAKRSAKPQKAAPAKKGAKPAAKKTAQSAPGTTSSPRGRRAADPALREAIDEATAEVLAPAADGARAKDGQGKGAKGKNEAKGHKGAKARKRRSKRGGALEPLPAVNEPLDFITFVAEHPLGSEVEGEVISYTSHGAMVAAALPDGRTLDCYIPLTGLAVPAPTKARQVIAKGERRTFVLIALDPARRVAELALPGVVP